VDHRARNEQQVTAVGDSWTTYRLADGDLIGGEFSFVTDTEFFEERDEPVDVVKETWVLQSSETVTFKPYGWDELQAEIAADA
jgi:hypothetical protein